LNFIILSGRDMNDHVTIHYIFLYHMGFLQSDFIAKRK